MTFIFYGSMQHFFASKNLRNKLLFAKNIKAEVGTGPVSLEHEKQWS